MYGCITVVLKINKAGKNTKYTKSGTKSPVSINPGIINARKKYQNKQPNIGMKYCLIYLGLTFIMTGSNLSVSTVLRKRLRKYCRVYNLRNMIIAPVIINSNAFTIIVVPIVKSSIGFNIWDKTAEPPIPINIRLPILFF